MQNKMAAFGLFNDPKNIIELFTFDLTTFFIEDDYEEISCIEEAGVFMIEYEKVLPWTEHGLFNSVVFRVFNDKKNIVGSNHINVRFSTTASSEKVNDNKEHFPIANVDQAKSALVRVSEYSTAPRWYDGPLSEVQAKVREAVLRSYPYLEQSSEEKELPEQARFYVHDIETIFRLMGEVDCLSCKEKGFSEIDSLDFKSNIAKIS